ncbi:MAG: DUF3046 domain-containing protein [Actinomycetes bacterium]
MRLTDLRERLSLALGPAYAASWAQDFVLAAIGGQTVDEAVASGVDVADIWRAVHDELRLPARLR